LVTERPTVAEFVFPANPSFRKLRPPCTPTTAFVRNTLGETSAANRSDPSDTVVLEVELRRLKSVSDSVPSIVSELLAKLVGLSAKVLAEVLGSSPKVTGEPFNLTEIANAIGAGPPKHSSNTSKPEIAR
jgi:hypothetical protein